MGREDTRAACAPRGRGAWRGGASGLQSLRRRCLCSCRRLPRSRRHTSQPFPQGVAPGESDRREDRRPGLLSREDLRGWCQRPFAALGGAARRKTEKPVRGGWPRDQVSPAPIGRTPQGHAPTLRPGLQRGWRRRRVLMRPWVGPPWAPCHLGHSRGSRCWASGG